MTIHLPADLEEAIREKVAAGRFGDEAELMREALDALDAREHDRFELLREKIRAGFEQPGVVVLSPELMDEIDREGELVHGVFSLRRPA